MRTLTCRSTFLYGQPHLYCLVSFSSVSQHSWLKALGQTLRRGTKRRAWARKIFEQRNHRQNLGSTSGHAELVAQNSLKNLRSGLTRQSRCKSFRCLAYGSSSFFSSLSHVFHLFFFLSLCILSSSCFPSSFSLLSSSL